MSPGLLAQTQEAAARHAGQVAAVCGPMGFGDVEALVTRLQDRIAAGAKEELLGLTSIPGIGASRARALRAAGYRTPEAVLAMSAKQLMALLQPGAKGGTGAGRAVAQMILRGARRLCAEQRSAAREASEAKLRELQRLAPIAPKPALVGDETAFGFRDDEGDRAPLSDRDKDASGLSPERAQRAPPVRPRLGARRRGGASPRTPRAARGARRAVVRRVRVSSGDARGRGFGHRADRRTSRGDRAGVRVEPRSDLLRARRRRPSAARRRRRRRRRRRGPLPRPRPRPARARVGDRAVHPRDARRAEKHRGPETAAPRDGRGGRRRRAARPRRRLVRRARGASVFRRAGRGVAVTTGATELACAASARGGFVWWTAAARRGASEALARAFAGDIDHEATRRASAWPGGSPRWRAPSSEPRAPPRGGGGDGARRGARAPAVEAAIQRRFSSSDGALDAVRVALERVEMPLVPVLASMEAEGVPFAPAALESQTARANARLLEIEAEAEATLRAAGAAPASLASSADVARACSSRTSRVPRRLAR